ncbi:hypothetical protein [Clavibacter michiganensis]|uniref:hypothetical protein n=1 Tax=Clavibacter michiganensis TaxID=28447 RepID=UPI0026DCD4EA|nr:hypothetical protein [Clavibacter michiganensis]MDO4066677.1 hypothetical protein [Clavibacter michiganensis]MDO4072779.1 hypothetical protein [Clavibacter michiganensis]MDO4091220.1 hypothetical protein [Clavibacter michiganensis]
MIDEAVLGVPAVVWNRAETGLGTFLFRRRVGQLITESQIKPLRLSSCTAEPMPGFAHGTEDSTTQFETLTSAFAALCFTEWPAVSNGDQVVDVDVLEAAGIDAQTLANLTSFDPASVLALWSQETILPEQIETLVSALGDLATRAIVAPDDAIIAELQRPRWKDSIIQIAEHRHVDERAARELVRSDVALAARTDSLADRRRNAVGDAIARLIQA